MSPRALALSATVLITAAPDARALSVSFAETGMLSGEVVTLAPDTAYTPGTGVGIVRGDPALSGDALVSDKPFHLAFRLPAGNYELTLTLGDPRGPSETVVKAETRRLLLEPLALPSDAREVRRFTVNLRTPALPDGRSVQLKDRERGYFHWDDTLLLEFNGRRPAVRSIELRRTVTATTVFLAGDSTVTDQPGEPWAAWGQMLPRFMRPEVAVANHAESGMALLTFRESLRLEQILQTMRKGDFVLIQFGHNDQKEKGEGVGAYTTYAERLREYITAVRAKGGTAVVVTPVYRRRFNEEGLYDTLGDFAGAARSVAAETGAPLIDLHEQSRRLLVALGPEGSKRAYVHVPGGVYPAHPKPVADDTHFSPYGAYELARCVVQQIRDNIPELAALLAPDVVPYSPDSPAPPGAFRIPESPPTEDVRIPDGDGR